MQQLNPSPSRASLVAALVAVLATPSAWAVVDSGSTGADGALNPTVSQEIQLPESGVLNYTTVNIPAGVTITFKKNSANTPVYLLASGDVTIAGTIDLNGKDAKPSGAAGDGVIGDDGIPGEGGPGGFAGGRGGRIGAMTAAIVRGGGGLGPGGGPAGTEGADSCSGNTGYVKGNGTGGAYADAALQYGIVHWCSSVGPKSTPYGSSLLQPLVGGSGGGGGRGGVYYQGTGGGGGGGAILIASAGIVKIASTGLVTAMGGDGGASTGNVGGGHDIDDNAEGRGAGGSGGAIRIVASRIEGNGKLYAHGGCITHGTTRRQHCDYSGSWGYGGSVGRIRLETESMGFTYSDSTLWPRHSFSTPGPIFIGSVPTLRIASVGGQPVPANPTGTADLTFPAATSQAPVQVTFETTNVPTGNKVNLRIVPAYGAPVEAISPAIDGSTAAGTAQVSVTLPSGPSTLQATTTYTVVVAALEDAALAEKLSRLAQNEQVEKIEVTVALQGGASARLITGTGKVFDLPYQALSAIGFRG